MAQFYHKEVHPQDNVSIFPHASICTVLNLICHVALLSAEPLFHMDL